VGLAGGNGSVDRGVDRFRSVLDMNEEITTRCASKGIPFFAYARHFDLLTMKTID
jgi:hypothetical protein